MVAIENIRRWEKFVGFALNKKLFKNINAVWNFVNTADADKLQAYFRKVGFSKGKSKGMAWAVMAGSKSYKKIKRIRKPPVRKVRKPYPYTRKCWKVVKTIKGYRLKCNVFLERVCEKMHFYNHIKQFTKDIDRIVGLIFKKYKKVKAIKFNLYFKVQINHFDARTNYYKQYINERFYFYLILNEGDFESDNLGKIRKRLINDASMICGASKSFIILSPFSLKLIGVV